MRIVHAKWGPTRGRIANYAQSLPWVGASVVTLDVSNPAVLKQLLRGDHQADVYHLHNAPSAWILDVLDAHMGRCVVEIDDDMILLAQSGDLDPIRSAEARAVELALLQLCAFDSVPVIAATPAFGSHLRAAAGVKPFVIRNFPLQSQLDAALMRSSPARRPDRVDALVYAGTTHDGATHHRNPARWPVRPDVTIANLFPVNLIRALCSFREGLIPFPSTPFTHAMEPHKLFEYMIAGMQVVCPANLEGVRAVRDEFPDPKRIPSWESQMPAVMSLYESRIAEANAA